MAALTNSCGEPFFEIAHSCFQPVRAAGRRFLVARACFRSTFFAENPAIVSAAAAHSGGFVLGPRNSLRGVRNAELQHHRMAKWARPRFVFPHIPRKVLDYLY